MAQSWIATIKRRLPPARQLGPRSGGNTVQVQQNASSHSEIRFCRKNSPQPFEMKRLFCPISGLPCCYAKIFSTHASWALLKAGHHHYCPEY
jgi:hypothetical protein